MIGQKWLRVIDLLSFPRTSWVERITSATRESPRESPPTDRINRYSVAGLIRKLIVPASHTESKRRL